MDTGFLHNLFLLEEWPQLGTTDLTRGTEEVAEPHWLLGNIILRVSLLLTFHKLKQVTQPGNDSRKLNSFKGQAETMENKNTLHHTNPTCKRLDMLI